MISFNPSLAFILIDDPGPRIHLSVSGKRGSVSFLRNLVEDLERITGLSLYIENGYLRVAQPGSFVVSANGITDVLQPAIRMQGKKWSSTAKGLLLSAIDSQSVYRVRGSRAPDLGRVYRNGSIELDFMDLRNVTFRDVPHETFNAGMVFLHELVHSHLGLLDPTLDELKMNPDARGATVEYVNRIERELGLPERLHYFPKKSLDPHNRSVCIYFGKGSDRIELDANLFEKKLGNKTGTAYLGLLRR